MTWRAQIDDHGVITRYKDLESGRVISAAQFAKQQQTLAPGTQYISPTTGQAVTPYANSNAGTAQQLVPPPPPVTTSPLTTSPLAAAPLTQPVSTFAQQQDNGSNPLIQSGAQTLGQLPASEAQAQPVSPTAPTPVQGKNLRMEGIPHPYTAQAPGFRTHGFLDATSIAILIPTLIILTLIIAAAHKKRLFPWQTLRPFNPPTGLMTPREYERSYLCPPNARRSGRMGKRDPDATWTEEDGTVLPFGFLTRTHLPVTIPLGRLPNKNMFIVAPSGSGKTTLMRAIIKAMLAKPCVIVALEAKANDPNLDELKEGFKFTVLPAAQEAGFAPLYFNPLDDDSVFWNPMDLDPITFASSLIPNINLLDPEEQHWAERDHGYVAGLATLLKWGAVMVTGEDESGIATDVQPLPCNPRGLMRLVNNRRNIVESLRRLRTNPDVDPMELSELSLTLSSIIRTDTDWDKNIQGVRGRLRMFKNPNILRVTEHSSMDLRRCMFEPTILIFGAPASLGPDAESLADCFVYQLQQAMHTRYGTASVLPLFAFFDEYQTLNLDIAGRLSAIVRGANGGLTVILQNVSQITGTAMLREGTMAGMAELKTIFSNSAIRICLHNADDSTARFFSDEIGKHAVVIPGVSDHFGAGGFATFPTAWNRIHSQQVVARVDTDAIKRMEAFHGLLYLSPAGGVFGEVKPLMVDLRGIEEIARIHLLHSKRPPVTPGDGPMPGAPAPGTLISAPDAPMPIPSVPSLSSGDTAPISNAAMSGSDMASSVPATTASEGESAPSSDRTVEESIIPATAQEAIGQVAAAARGTASVPLGPGARRICPNCGNIAGRGKFCISCGKPLATESSPDTPAPDNFQKPRLTDGEVVPYPANNQTTAGPGGLRRIPPPSMPSVYGIRTNSNNSLAPRAPQSAQPAADDANSNGNPPNNSYTFRTVNPSWTTRPPQ
jgi:hypothetical protein